MPFKKRRRRSRASAPRRRSYRFGKRFHRRKDKSIPISYLAAAAVPLGTIFGGDSQAKGIIRAFTEDGASGNWAQAAKEIEYALTHGTIGYTSYDGHWDFSIPMRNVAAIVAAIAVHRLARPLNAKMKNLPLIGKYLSI